MPSPDAKSGGPLRIGVHIIGDDYANAPPAHALSRRGMVSNVVGYSVYGDYSSSNPPARLVDAVGQGDIDVAVVWGPLAGYFARLQPVPLDLRPVAPEIDLPFLPFVFDIAMGVRHGELELRDRLDAIIVRRVRKSTRCSRTTDCRSSAACAGPAIPTASVP